MNAHKRSFSDQSKARLARRSLGRLAIGTSLIFSVNLDRAAATDMTAGVIMEKMKPEERYIYIAGIIEGTAYARFLRDGKQEAGMKCIYDWFYDTKTAVEDIYVAFAKFGTYPPGAIVSALVDKKCGVK